MKKLNTTESVDFIKTATDKDFLAYIEVRPFKNTVEPEIYLHRSSEISLAYIKKYGFDEATRCLIFKQDHPTLVSALLQWGEESGKKAIFKDFLAYGSYKTVKAYTETHESVAYPEANLFAPTQKVTLQKRIKQQKLSPFAKLRVIMESDSVTLRTMIDSPHQNFDKREEDAFFTNAKKEDIEYWLNQKPFHSKRKEWHQKYLIRFGSEKELEDLINEKKLAKGTEEFFFCCAPFYLIMHYMDLYQPEKGEEYLFTYCKHGEVMNFLSRHKVSDIGEAFLLKRGDHDEIMLFIDKQHFNDENEVTFVNRGIESELMTYLRYYSLSDMAQLALIKGRNLTAISYFINHYPLADIAYAEIMKDSRLRGMLCPHLAETDD